MTSNRRGVVAPGLAVMLAALTCACALARRPVKLPPQDGVATVFVASMTLMEPLEQIARHPWFAFRERGSQTWHRWEILNGGGGDWGYITPSVGGPLDGDEVRIHGIIRGDDATRFIACLKRESARYEHRHTYRAWPGPNSNTYVDVMLRRCKFRAELPSTSIGKDYRGVIGASLTTGRTGVQIETPIIGLRIGLTEGIQLHLFSFTVGIDWWPPAIIVPVGEGRIGFDDR